MYGVPSVWRVKKCFTKLLSALELTSLIAENRGRRIKNAKKDFT